MSNKVKRLYIEQFRGFKEFELKINENTTILVGKNGTGKTTILEIIYNMLSGNMQYFKEDASLKSIELELVNGRTIKVINGANDIEIYIDDKKVEANNEFFEMKKVIYIPTEVVFSNYEVTGPKKLESTENDVLLSSDKMSKELKQFLINQKYQDLNDIANGNIENANRIEKYKKIYNDFLEDKKFIGIDNESFEPLFELNNTGKKITIDKLSSGEKQIFYRGGAIVQYGEKNEITILIDEPEISMHPNWQQKILAFYENINPSAQFVFATHSPHIVSSCKSEEIRVITKENDMLKVEEDLMNTYGLSNEEILFNVFDLDSVRDISVQKDMNEYKKLFCRRETLSEEDNKRMTELKQKLKQNVGLSKSDIALLEFESNTEKFEEIFKRLGDK